VNLFKITIKQFFRWLYIDDDDRKEYPAVAMKNISFDQYGAVARVSGKTGDRRVRLIESFPDLRLYLDMHPNRDNLEGAIWADNRACKKTI
jgi:hypothetical protein